MRATARTRRPRADARVARDADVVVVGGGVVGLAVAAALARAGREVWLLERRAGLGQETTSRNSEVIHAGLYYPEGSLKARLCVAGREALYARCARHGIPHRRLGKLVVAVADEEVAALEALRAGPRTARRGWCSSTPPSCARASPRYAVSPRSGRPRPASSTPPRSARPSP